jgi:hypothetical protein
MIMQDYRLWIAAVLCCSQSLVYAQQATQPPPLVGPGPFALIKNAPYSAEIVKERQQNLGDGNQIIQRTTALAYRDSAGRTREEFRTDKGEAQTVVIKDPAAGMQWLLHTRTKSAVAYAMPTPRARSALKAPDDGKARIVDSAGGPERMRVEVTSGPRVIDSASYVMLPRIGPVLADAFGDIKWSAQSVRRDLGTREIDGVKANGRLRSYEIPAGAVGNRNAILVTDEIWYAPDLRITLSSKHSDPRLGDSVFRIENLKTQEPDAALFAVPSDYKVTNPKELAAARKAEQNLP